jgi:dolichol-phosphate mannosyltransferase
MEQSFARRVMSRLLSPRILRFLAVGFSGVFVNLGMLNALVYLLGVDPVVSKLAAIEVSIIWNFILNDAWTFKDKNAQAQARYPERLVRYNVASLVGLAIQFGTSTLIEWMATRLQLPGDPGIWMNLSQLVGIGVGTVWNFFSNFFWTWAQQKPTDAGHA